MSGLVDSDTGLAFGTSLVWQDAIGGSGLDIVTNSAPSWVINPGGNNPAAMDIDFVNDRAYNSAGTPTTTPAISSLLSCQRASTGYYQNSNGTLTQFSNNVLRYGTNGLLVENAATNLCVNSQDYTTWNKVNLTTTLNATTAPDGTTTASKIAYNSATNTNRFIYTGFSLTSSTTYIVSCYLKAAEYSFGGLDCSDGTSDYGVVYNLISGSVVGTRTGGGAIAASGMDSLANGWYRCWLQFTSTSGATSPTFAAQINVFSVSGTNFGSTGAGTSGSGIYAWGYQHEAGAFETSYIPTAASSVTRAADVVSFTNTGWLSTSTGSFYAQAAPESASALSASPYLIGLSSSNTAGLGMGTANTACFDTNGTTSLSATAGAGNWTSLAKAAFAYDGTGQALCMNAGTVATNSAIQSSFNAVRIGSVNGTSNFANGTIKEVAAWGSKLTSANLQTITSAVAPSAFYPVANRTFFPNEAGGASNVYILSQTHHTLFDNVSGQIRIQWPNVYATSGSGTVDGGAAEISPGASATATANITYIDASTKIATTVNLVDFNTGLTSLTAPNGGLFDAVATINGSAGDPVYPKIAANFPNGMMYAQWQADIPNGDLFQFGSSPIPLSNTPTNSFASNLAYYGPCSIRASTAIASYGICGDSRGSGLDDVANDLYGNIGNMARLIGKRLPYINTSIPGDTAGDFALASQSTVRRALLNQAKSGTFVVLGTNDIIFVGESAAQTKTWIDQIVASLNTPSAQIYMTLDPATTDNTNTTIARPANEPARKSFNTTVRGQSRFYDPASVLENGGATSPTGLWINTTVEGDGTHETNTGNQLAADTSGFNYADIGSPSVVNAGFQYAANPLYQSLTFGSGWTTQQSSLSTLQVYSPSHQITAAILKEDASASTTHDIFAQPTLTLASTTKTFTVFAKRISGARNAYLSVQETNTFGDGRVAVDLGTGSTFFGFSTSSHITFVSSTVTAYETYYKIAMVLTFDGTTNANPFVYCELCDGTGNNTYNGDGTSSVAFWGYDVR